jgi:ATP-binding protein involved in chromosome partitioning
MAQQPQAPLESAVITALRGVDSGTGGLDVVARGWVKGLTIKDGHITFALEVPARDGERLEPVRAAAEAAVRGVRGVSAVTAVLTAQVAQAPRTAPGHGHAHAHGHAHGQAQGHGRPERLALPTVKHIIAIASGKGGVGKSTTAANLAVAFAKTGLKAAIFDADVFGPSVPRMFGLSGRKPSSDGKTVIPLEAYGVKVMSIGFMVAEDNPIIWRGPMVMGALEQMLRDVSWGEIDVMVVDMPPGTGDTQLTVSQRVPLAGAVIVSTPQDIALIDARKGLNMFRRVEVPILGIIENMSYYVCPNCGHREDIFAHGGAQRTAAELGVPFLGEIPLELAIRATSDAGTPIVSAEPDGPHTHAYVDIARTLWETMQAAQRRAPTISMSGAQKD